MDDPAVIAVSFNVVKLALEGELVIRSSRPTFINRPASAGLGGDGGGHVPRLRHDMHQNRPVAGAAVVRDTGQDAVGGLCKGGGGDSI